jgi:hypothetical protein
VAMAGCLALASSCSKDKSDDTTGATTTAPPKTTTTVTTATPEQADEAELRRIAMTWDQIEDRLVMHPNPSDPALARYLAGDMLGSLTKIQQDLVRQHQAARPATPDRAMFRIDAVKVTGDQGTLEECAVNDGVLYDTQSGKVIDDSVATIQLRTKAERVGGSWKLNNRTELHEWEGIAGCALDK